MRYILEAPFRLRGWEGAPTGLVDAQAHCARFLSREEYSLLLRCDGVHEFMPEQLDEAERAFLAKMEGSQVIRPAWYGEFLSRDQAYRLFPSRFRERAEWSITGACNLRCRHCFMSAPSAKHGSPSLAQLEAVADQLAECGVLSVDITGGEPLVHPDFASVLSLLRERGIGLRSLLTNGWLLDDALLDEIEAHGFRPDFQLSFDGVGRHDFLRGVPGAEARVIQAFELLRHRGFEATAAMTLHRRDADTLRQTVLRLSSLGVRELKCGGAMALGEWAGQEVRGLRLTREEELEIYERYIPQYFEDGAPMAINLSGVFSYTPGEETWGDRGRMNAPVREEALACATIQRCLAIGADGVVAPCMGMTETDMAGQLPNLNQTDLRDVLGDSDFTARCAMTVREIRDQNPGCRACAYAAQCDGGCRMNALLHGNGFYGIDPLQCMFFKSGWSKRIRAAAEPALEKHLRLRPRQSIE